MAGRSPWLKQYQSQPQAFYKGGDTLFHVALTIHLVGNDEGTAYYGLQSLFPAMCKLNELFAPSHIRFFIEGDLNYINNSSYHDHETVHEGAEMMFANNRPNTLNVYFVQNPAGNCGYNLPYAGIANSIACSGPNDVTWAHEVGHALSLPHPFLGWEGGVSWDGSVDHDFNSPAPERVTYNYTFFQQTYFPPDTLIIDTAYVEKVDGSNCAIAADGFCDTPPDYLASRWSCNGNGLSNTLQTDPNGERFQSEGSFVMNYANDRCQTRFSEEQIAAMRAFLHDQRSNWLRSRGYDLPITESVRPTAPEDGVSPPANATLLSWTSATHATNYLVQVSRLSSFPGAVTQTYVTSDTSIVLPELAVGRTYYWRVLPYNNLGGCQDFTPRRSFLTSDFVNST
ncbi:MAG: metalloprotease, partial [Bacteroidetes bacterium]